MEKFGGNITEFHVTKEVLLEALYAVDSADLAVGENNMMKFNIEQIPHVLKMLLYMKQNEYLRTPVDQRPDRPVVVTSSNDKIALVPLEHRTFIRGWLAELGAEVHGGEESMRHASLSPVELRECADTLRDLPIGAEDMVVIDTQKYPVLAKAVRAQSQTQQEQHTKMSGAVGFDSSIIAREDTTKRYIFLTTTWQKRLERSFRHESVESAMRLASLDEDMEKSTRDAARNRRRVVDVTMMED